MKIGIDIRTLMDARYSGISEYTSNLIKGILKLDRKNYYKLFYNSFRDVGGRLPEFNFTNVEEVGKNYPNKILNYFYFKLFARPKIDRLLGVDLFFMPHINFIALSDKCKKVITVHDLSFLRYGKFFSRRKNFWHTMINVKKMLQGFDKIIAVSENTKNDIIDMCSIEPEKIKVIYSGIGEKYREIEPSAPKMALVKKKYNLSGKFIFYLGTLEPRKNVEGIIRAYEELQKNNKGLSEYHLVVAGGKGWKFNSIFNAWQSSKYKDKIKFLGYVDDADKAYLYNLASVFVFPSFYEGFGFPPLEAMACGCPVITSSTSSLPEVVGEAAVLVNPYDISQIADATKQLLNNRGLMAELIKKGLVRAKQFSWEKTAQSYLEIFKSF